MSDSSNCPIAKFGISRRLFERFFAGACKSSPRRFRIQLRALEFDGTSKTSILSLGRLRISGVQSVFQSLVVGWLRWAGLPLR
eukprot:2566152-Amphidinium_carterae.1